MSIPRDHPIDLVEEPWRSWHLPRPRRPTRRPTDCESERNCPCAADLRAVVCNGPRCHLSLICSDAGAIADAKLLRRNNLESLLVSEAPDPPGAPRAKASIPVKDECGAIRPPIRKLAVVHEHSVPAPIPARADEHHFRSGRTSAER
jgi:hypothetical protein